MKAMERFEYGKFDTIINGARVIFCQHDVHQCKGGQYHLRTDFRDTYISSRWVKATSWELGGFKSFKVKVKGLDYETALGKAIAKVEKMTEVTTIAKEADSENGFTDNSKVMDDDYFTASQHRFMTAVTETLIECGWEDDEARDVAPDVLTDWEYAEVSDKAVYHLYYQPTSPEALAGALGITADDVVVKINRHMASLPYGSFRLEL